MLSQQLIIVNSVVSLHFVSFSMSAFRPMDVLRNLIVSISSTILPSAKFYVDGDGGGDCHYVPLLSHSF